MKSLLLLVTFFASLFAVTQQKEISDPQEIFTKKCVGCHITHPPKTPEQKKALAGPPIHKPLKSVTITIDAVDGPFKDDELREEVIAFMKDYIMNPHPSKTNCEPEAIEAYGYMPSLKGYITPKQLDILVPWLYDTYKPKKVNGEWE